VPFPDLLLYAALKRRSSPVFAGVRACTVEVKIKVKASGRGRPLHTRMSTKVDVYFSRLYVP